MTSFQRWQVIRNPHAYHPVPESLLEKIRIPAAPEA
jgi:hypothetical protein